MGETGQNDARLVQAAKNGDKAAFERLVEDHFPMVYAIAYARCGDAKQSEDMSQEVFLRAYLYLDSLSEPKRFAGWLSRITRNLAISWHRKNQKNSVLLSQLELGEMPDRKVKGAHEVMEKQEDAEFVRKAIFALPAEQREVVMLHYFEKMSQRQIAEKLEVHPVTVGRILKKSLAKMKGSLGSMLYDVGPAFRAKPATIGKTVAMIGAVTLLNTSSKAALMTAAGGKAWVGCLSVGAAKTAASGGGIFGLVKGVTTTAITGVKIMAIGKGTAIAVSLIMLTVAGTLFYRQMPEKKVSTLPKTQKDTLRAKKECFPDEVYEYIMQTSLNGKELLDPSMQPSIVATIAKTIDKNRNIWGGALLRFSSNVPIPATTEDILVASGRRESNLLCVFDEYGELMKHRFEDVANTSQDSNIPPNIKNLYVTIDTPLEANEDGVLFMMDSEGRLRGSLIEMHGKSMFGGVFQHVLILPQGYEVVELSEDVFLVDQIGKFEVYVWQKMVKTGEEYNIEVVLERI